jgi:hypothetical protein
LHCREALHRRRTGAASLRSVIRQDAGHETALSWRRGAKRGKVALARKLAVVLHVSETDFRYAAAKEA